jgi:hypothetical protein
MVTRSAAVAFVAVLVSLPARAGEAVVVADESANSTRRPFEHELSLATSAFGLMSIDHLGGLLGARAAIAAAPTRWFNASRIVVSGFGGIADGSQSTDIPDVEPTLRATDRILGASAGWNWGAPYTRSVVGGSVEIGGLYQFRDGTLSQMNGWSRHYHRSALLPYTRSTLVLQIPFAGDVRPFLAPSIALVQSIGARTFAVESMQVGADLGIAWGLR